MHSIVYATITLTTAKNTSEAKSLYLILYLSSQK